ncbi:creatininase family protein [Deinococcus peraridilitoris]|uniref:creatininase family protein n=1 Tax=Deinococcus peraridilitoris TaxID=432329 RepID=UPI00059C3B9E|nr:creatininase family protein [Deinococcus peraridilitoris]
MRITDMNWMQVEEYLLRDDRCILPLGCTEQHAYLSLATDTILATKLAGDVAEGLNISVFPALTFGITPHFMAYPGTVSASYATYTALLSELLGSLYETGFRRILIINGHGGNSPAQQLLPGWTARSPGARVKWHDWWIAPQTWAAVQEVHPVASHASWMENFPWTRLMGVEMPENAKAAINWSELKGRSPQDIRLQLGDGNFGGPYQVEGRHMARIWQTAVQQTRRLLESAWE